MYAKQKENFGFAAFVHPLDSFPNTFNINRL